MSIKTFNLDEEVYKEFSAHCKKHGISMSKRIENFLRDEVSKLKAKSGTGKKANVEKVVSAIKTEHHSFSKYC